MTSIILTGGSGTRMQPLSFEKSKSMLPLMGKPLLVNLVRSLCKNGFSDIIFTSSGKFGEIIKYFSNGKEWGATISYYENQSYYGTAGTVKNIIEELSPRITDTVLIIYGDSLLKTDFSAMMKFHLSKKSLCTILYHRPSFEAFIYEPVENTKDQSQKEKQTNYGVMDIDADNKITSIIEKPYLRDINKFTQPVANAAVYLMDKHLFDIIPADYTYDFARHLFPSLLENRIPCWGFDIGTGYRFDLGTLVNYYNAHFAILEGLLDFESYYPCIAQHTWVGNNTMIDTSCRIEKPILIAENSKISRETNLFHSIIGNNVTIGEGSTVQSSIIFDNAQIGKNVHVNSSIIGEHSIIGDGVSIPLKTILGNYCRLRDTALNIGDQKSDIRKFIRDYTG